MIEQVILDLVTKIDTATTAVGRRIESLLSEIGGNMSPVDVQTLQGALQREADKLVAMAAPTDPTVASAITPVPVSDPAQTEIAPTVPSEPSAPTPEVPPAPVVEPVPTVPTVPTEALDTPPAATP